MGRRLACLLPACSPRALPLHLGALRSSSARDPTMSELAAQLAGDAVLGVAKATGLAARLAPVPGLLPAAELLGAIVVLCRQVKVNRNGAQMLGDRCEYIKSAIEKASGTLSPSDALDEAVRQASLILTDVHDRMAAWAHTSRIKSFFKQGLIEGDIKTSIASVDQVVERLQISSLFHMNEWQMEFEATAARDHAETMEILSANLCKTDLIDQTLHNQADSQKEIMAMLQQALTTGKTEPTQQEGLRENLYHASNHFGELELLPVLRLQQGGEVVRVGQQAYTRTLFSETWEGKYLGKVRVDMKTLCITRMDPKNLDRLEREATLWTKLWETDRGKHIVRIFGYSFDGDAPWIVSEWHKNGHAFNYARLNPDVDLKKLILGIAHGVRVLHNMSPPVIHGDITGQHVLIDTRGRPLLSEFTFTRMVNDLQKGGVDLTQSKGVSEAIRFTACEHLMGDMFMTRATDVWAVAMTALQLLTGDRPFAEIKSNNAITYLCYTGTRPRRPEGQNVRDKGLNDACWGLLERSWQKEPAERPTIDEFIVELETNVWPGTVVD